MAPARREASAPLALPSTASSKRSKLGTKPRASSSSRSSLYLSASRNGSRRSAQRSIGGIAMVVTTAMPRIGADQHAGDKGTEHHLHAD
jgi:hypothetical protein